jgi:predicted Zn-dependent peptidase
MERPVPGGIDPVRPAARASALRPIDVGAVTSELDLGVFETILPSGARILSERIDSVRSAAIGLWFRSGSAHEPPELGGISHLLEHMVFKGTERRSARELALAIEGLGGSLDAYTAHEHTSFMARVPDTELRTALDVLSDLSFAPTLSADDLALEREVVLEEIARADETPDDLVFELHGEFLFGGHPYGSSILGRRDTVDAIDAVALRRLHSSSYCPAALVVAAAGRVEHEELVELVERLLPDEPGQRPRDVDSPGSFGTGFRKVARSGGSQVHIVAGAPGIAWGDPLRDASIVVGTALGGGMTSRLFQRIREELGLAYAVFSWQSFYRTGGAVGAYLGTRPESADRARDTLLSELQVLADQGLSEEEDRETRTQIKGQLLLSLESPSSRMHRLAGTVLHDEPYRSLDEISARVDAVTRAEVEEACAMLHPDGLAVLELAPA